MSATVTIDKAGRIVVPRKLREELHLVAGTALRIERSGDRLTLMPASYEAHLEIINGTPLIFPATSADIPVVTTEMVNEVIAQGRLERMRRVMGLASDEEAV
ncbi:MAG: AbrB/MazE/SpoVT family DNA-binding domain-containing protein [Acidobacteriota bacterium]